MACSAENNNTSLRLAIYQYTKYDKLVNIHILMVTSYVSNR